MSRTANRAFRTVALTLPRLTGDPPGRVLRTEVQPVEVRQQSQLGRDGARQVVLSQAQGRHGGHGRERGRDAAVDAIVGDEEIEENRQGTELSGKRARERICER